MKSRRIPIFGKHISYREPEFFRFLFVGGVGFCIDGGLLTLLMQSEWEVFPARAVSFMSAVTCTWLFNRFWTFGSNGRLPIRKEYAAYMTTQVVGAIINLSVFFVLIYARPAYLDMPFIPLAFGAGVSLIFNYMVSKNYVFKG